MTFDAKKWVEFVTALAKIDAAATKQMADYINKSKWTWDKGTDELIRFAYTVSRVYGEAAAAVACEVYDAVAFASGVNVPAAEPADVATFAEVAKTINGTAKTRNPEIMSSSIGRLVKRTGADTTLKNAVRDGAQYAWIPHGDTCAFCLALASRGWQGASQKILKNGHAEHIHGNCDCMYGVRFNENTNYAGYDPDRYLAMYKGADGGTPEQKINSMRRQFYAQNKERINEQKRAAYTLRKEREASAAEEKNIGN